MLLFADWSSVALELLALDAKGQILDSRRAEVGAMSQPPGGHAACLADLAGDWLAGAGGCYVAGMATGRGGWQEVPYVSAPAGISDLASGALAAPGIPAQLLPGLSSGAGLPDVMRGEELKVFGLEPGFTLAILPGRHSKWVRIEAGRITGFRTFLTGELLEAFSGASILSRLMPADPALSAAGLSRGLRQAGQGGVLSALFAGRSLVLFDQMPPEDIRGYLAGLLIGTELAEFQAEFGALGGAAASKVAVIGAGALPDAVAAALESAGLAVHRHRDGQALAARAVAALQDAIQGLP